MKESWKYFNTVKVNSCDIYFNTRQQFRVTLLREICTFPLLTGWHVPTSSIMHSLCILLSPFNIGGQLVKTQILNKLAILVFPGCCLSYSCRHKHSQDRDIDIDKTYLILKEVWTVPIWHMRSPLDEPQMNPKCIIQLFWTTDKQFFETFIFYIGEICLLIPHYIRY